MKFEEKIRATKLRLKGLSYKEILKEVEVSKSTLSLWLREVELTNEQKKHLLNKKESVIYEIAKRKIATRIKTTQEVIANAREEFNSLKHDPLFLTGISLYWAEGSKHKGEDVKFSNSDDKMIELMMSWFRKICKVPEEKFRIHIHLHTLHCRKDILKFWSEVTGIKRSKFYKPYIKPTSLVQRRNILYSGTCSIIIHDKNLFRRIVGWKMGIQDYLICSRSSMDRTKGF